MTEQTTFTPQGIQRLVAEAKDLMTVRQVVGEPIERDGATLVPVVEVRGGGGGGGGGGNANEDSGSGEGMGFAMRARPVGSYVIADGRVTWEPAIDVTRIAVISNIALMTVFLSLWFGRRRSA